MYQALFGLVADLLIFIFFVYAALLLHGVVSFKSAEKQAKVEAFKAKKSSFFIAYGGIVCFVLMLLLRFV